MRYLLIGLVAVSVAGCFGDAPTQPKAYCPVGMHLVRSGVISPDSSFIGLTCVK